MVEKAPAFLDTCGNPACGRRLYVFAIAGRQDILCGKCGATTQFTLESNQPPEQEDDE